MKNKVYGLVSMVISPEGVITKDGTLLFPNKERADNFLKFVNDASAQNQKTTHLRGSSRSHYEHGQEYIVSNSIAEFVHTKKTFFVSEIANHIVENIIEDTSQDVAISQISLIEADEDKDNIIENES